MSQWWLSFVDIEKSDPPEEQVPGGGGFLGVVIVEADGPIAAVRRTWDLGVNPGGEVQISGPSPVVYPPEMMDRLLPVEEAKEL